MGGTNIRLFELPIGQLDLFLDAKMDDGNRFQLPVWRCLLQAQTKEEVEGLLGNQFSQTSEGSLQSSGLESATHALFLDAF